MSSVEEFLDAFGEGTRRVYRAGLSAFREYYEGVEGGTLDDFLDAVDEDLRLPRRQRRHVARNVLRGFVRWLRDKGYTPKTIRAYVSAVQSYAKYFDIPISTRFVGVPPSKPVSSKVPWSSADEVANFIELINNAQVRAVAVIIFQSGLSVSDILALTWSDIKYEYERGVVPLCFDLARIKTDVPFMTFIGRWGVSELKKQLRGRRLGLEDPLFDVSHRLIDLHFERAAERWVGEYRGQNPARPHSLRAAFKTILGQAGCPYDVVEFWMGHKLPEQVRVYNSRTRDGWRRIYAKYEKYLTPKSLVIEVGKVD